MSKLTPPVSVPGDHQLGWKEASLKSPEGKCLDPQFSPIAYCFVRCRKCAACLRVKRFRYSLQAEVECRSNERTWLVTLTFKKIPDRAYPEIQKWLKRVRKNTDEKIKYLCTTEYGTQNGRLHYHLLVHGTEKLQRRMLENHWHNGFTNARLIDRQRYGRACRYVTKYVLKDSRERVRKSKDYGIPF